MPLTFAICQVEVAVRLYESLVFSVQLRVALPTKVCYCTWQNSLLRSSKTVTGRGPACFFFKSLTQWCKLPLHSNRTCSRVDLCLFSALCRVSGAMLHQHT